MSSNVHTMQLRVGARSEVQLRGAAAHQIGFPANPCKLAAKNHSRYDVHKCFLTLFCGYAKLMPRLRGKVWDPMVAPA